MPQSRVLFAMGLLASVLPAAEQTDPACWLAADAANWAQELSETANPRELKSVLTQLKIGTEQCRDEKKKADAWYYQALLEERLKGTDKDLAPKWKERAQEYGSLAAQKNLPLFGFKKPEAAPATGPVREKWALIVGISQFKSEGVTPLTFTAKDASDFAAVLKDPAIGRFKPDNVQVLLDKEATLVNIRTALGAIRGKANGDDLVVLYVSSHGSPRELDPRGVSYVIAYDTDISGPDTIYATGLALTEIVNTLNRDVEAQRLAIFLDTCYSGAAARTEPSGARALIPVKVPPTVSGANAFSPAFSQFTATGWAAIAASRGDQQSWESPQLRQGYFTYYLLEALRETQGNATLKDLFDRLQAKVSEKVRQDKNAEQTPVMSSGADGARLILGVQPGAAKLSAGLIQP